MRWSSGDRGSKMGKRGLSKLMRQAAAAQQKMAAVEEELGEREFTGSAGGGVVQVVVNGKHEVKAVKIDPKVVNPEEVELLEDLVLAAASEAHRLAETTVKAEMDKVTGDLDLGNMFQ
jgi:DNA-binding YbaB/EbfC family protein